MRITKLGHCCLIVEIKGKRILTDPGSYSTLQDEQKNIDIILITHEHGDHLHIESLKKVLVNNPSAQIITNTAVGKLLDVESIKYQILEGTTSGTFLGVLLEAFDARHEEIYEEFGQVQNTGYFIENTLFYPGDAFYNPGKPVDILALPVAGPWMRLKRAIEYGKEIKPRICFPVHDGILVNPELGSRLPSMILPKLGIEFRVLEIGKEEEI